MKPNIILDTKFPLRIIILRKRLIKQNLLYNRIAHLCQHDYCYKDEEVTIKCENSVDWVEPSRESIEHV